MTVSYSTCLAVVKYAQVTGKVFATVVPVVGNYAGIPRHEYHSTWKTIHRDLRRQTNGAGVALAPILVTVLPLTAAYDSKTRLHPRSDPLVSININRTTH